MKLNEVDYFEKNIQYHDQLNPMAWSGWNLKSDIRERLLDIAQLFVDYLEMPDFEVDDVVLTGSMANFNWTQYSDFDLHIVTDYSDLDCDNIAETLYRAKKTIWNDQHDITIHGYDVELYIEDSARPPHSAGMFSILNNKWIERPEYLPPKYDKTAVNRKVQKTIDLIQNTLSDSSAHQDLKKVIEKIYRMRQSGLETGGEFSTENLAFKALRNMGYIQRLRDRYNTQIDQKMSI